MQLLISNPGKKKGRGKRKTRKGGQKGSPMAKKRKARKSRKGGSAPIARAAARSAKRRRRGGFSAIGVLAGSSFSVKSVAIQGGVAGVGAIGVNYIINKIAGWLPASLTSGTGRALAKAGLGIGLGIAAKKFGMGKYAAALAMGGVMVAVLDINTAKASGLKGIDYFGQDGMSGLGQLQLQTAPDGSVFDGAGRLLWSPALAA